MTSTGIFSVVADGVGVGVVEPPADTDIARWPFVHSAAGDFYMLPEAGRLPW